MWWIQTTGYHFGGLIWLIVIAVIFVIALVALSTAGAAASSARRTRLMVRDHEAHHMATGVGVTTAATAPPPPVEDPAASVVEPEPPATDPGLGDSMRILHERYARGEITREEYLRAREDMMAMTH